LEAIPVGTVILAGVLWFLHEGLTRQPDAEAPGHLTAPRAG